MLTRVLTKQRYVAACQGLMLLAVVATMVLAVSGVVRLDIVGPRTSAPTDQTVQGTPAQAR